MSEPLAPRRHMSRREFIGAAAGAGFAVVATSSGLLDGYAYAAGPNGVSGLGTGTVPEQIHLTWGRDAARSMTVSWVSPVQQERPQVLLHPEVDHRYEFPALHNSYVDGLSGETVHAYHVTLDHLEPGTQYNYTVRDGAAPSVTFNSTFTTALSSRFPFAFTSFGDLGTPGAGATYTLADGSTVQSSTYSESQWNAYTAVSEVEVLAPLFHLCNGDLCYADKATTAVASPATNPATGSGAPSTPGVQTSPEVWRDFGLNTQRSAANRPWMPCIGNHEAELVNGPYGYEAYNTRYRVPYNGTEFPGNFYSFQVGSVLFISLDANDVCFQGGGAYNISGLPLTDAHGNPVAATAARYNQFYTGTFVTNADGTWTPGGANPNQQTLWLTNTLKQARQDTTIDWIVVQMHQSALSNSTDNGCDAGIRQAWLPLFAQYQVDLVVNGHDHDYGRSFPVKGFTKNLGTSTFVKGVNPDGSVTQATGPVMLPNTNGQTGINTFTPNVIASATVVPGVPNTPQGGTYDTTQGTVFLVLGGGGTNKRDNQYLATTANVTTFTQIRVGANGGTKPAADATEPAAWAAMTDPTDAYGIALFAVDPGAGVQSNTTITVTYYHAGTQNAAVPPAQNPGPAYSVLETFQLTRPRSDRPSS